MLPNDDILDTTPRDNSQRYFKGQLVTNIVGTTMRVLDVVRDPYYGWLYSCEHPRDTKQGIYAEGFLWPYRGTHKLRSMK